MKFFFKMADESTRFVFNQDCAPGSGYETFPHKEVTKQAKTAAKALAQEIKESQKTEHKVQSGDSLGAIVQGLNGGKLDWGMDVEFRVKDVPCETIKLSKANLIHPGQHVWIEKGLVVVSDVARDQSSNDEVVTKEQARRINKVDDKKIRILPPTDNQNNELVEASNQVEARVLPQTKSNSEGGRARAKKNVILPTVESEVQGSLRNVDEIKPVSTEGIQSSADMLESSKQESLGKIQGLLDYIDKTEDQDLKKSLNSQKIKLLEIKTNLLESEDLNMQGVYEIKSLIEDQAAEFYKSLGVLEHKSEANSEAWEILQDTFKEQVGSFDFGQLISGHKETVSLEKERSDLLSKIETLDSPSDVPRIQMKIKSLEERYEDLVRTHSLALLVDHILRVGSHTVDLSETGSYITYAGGNLRVLGEKFEEGGFWSTLGKGISKTTIAGINALDEDFLGKLSSSDTVLPHGFEDIGESERSGVLKKSNDLIKDIRLMPAFEYSWEQYRKNPDLNSDEASPFHLGISGDLQFDSASWNELSLDKSLIKSDNVDKSWVNLSESEKERVVTLLNEKYARFESEDSLEEEILTNLTLDIHGKVASLGLSPGSDKPYELVDGRHLDYDKSWSWSEHRLSDEAGIQNQWQKLNKNQKQKMIDQLNKKLEW